MKQSMIIFCALLAMVLSPAISGEAPVDASKDAKKVTVVEIGLFADNAYCTNAPAACNQSDCETEGKDWCTNNEHDVGDHETSQTYSLQGQNGHCTVICPDGYMATIIEECNNPTADPICPVDQHRRATIVTSPEGRIWKQFNPPNQPRTRIILFDPFDQ